MDGSISVGMVSEMRGERESKEENSPWRTEIYMEMSQPLCARYFFPHIAHIP